MRLRGLVESAKRSGALLGALFLGALLVAVSAGTAQAHANLVRSEPAASAVLASSPAEVRLWFSEPPELSFSPVQLRDVNGKLLDATGLERIDPSDPKEIVVPITRPLPPGIYTVVWAAASATDGHQTNGSFAFSVGTGQAPPATGPVVTPGAGGPTVPQTAAKWLLYFALALLLGGLSFFLLVARPSFDAGTSYTGVAADADQPPQSAKGIVTLLLLMLQVGWLLCILATIVDAVLRAGTGAGVGPLAALGTPLQILLTSTRFAWLFWSRIALLGVLGGLIGFGRWSLLRSRRGSGLWWLALALAGLVALTVSLGSHAAGSSSPITATTIDWLHLMAAGTWIGLLVALSLALLTMRRAEGDSSAGLVRGMVGLVSRSAFACVAVLLLTGVYQAVSEAGDWANVTDTSYGRTLLIKLSLLVPLLALAAVNLLLVKGRLASSISGSDPRPSSSPWYRRICGRVAGEVLFLLAVLLATAVLTGLPPAHEAFGPGVVLRGQADDVRVVLVVNPGQATINTFDIYVRDAADTPIVDAEKASLIITSLDMEMGTAEAVARSAGNGHYVTSGAYISMGGAWNIQVLVRRAGRDDVRIDLVLHAASASTPGTSAKAGGYRLPNQWTVDPGAIMGTGVLLGAYVWGISLFRRRRHQLAEAVTEKQVVNFLAGAGVLLLALVSPLAVLSDEYLFSAHVLQQLLLVMVVPPLLLLGTPSWLLRPLVQASAVRRAGRVLTHPAVALIIFNTAFWLWHLPSLYETALGDPEIRAIQSLSLVTAALINWWPVLSPLAELPPLPSRARMIYLLADCLPNVLLGALLALSGGVIYTSYASAPRLFGMSPEQDQQLGGLILCAAGSAAYLLAVGITHITRLRPDGGAEQEEAASTGKIEIKRGRD